MKLYKPMRIATAIVMGLCTSFANADSLDRQSLWVNAGFYTAHFDHNKGLRNANPGLGLEWTLNDTYSLTAGGFKNSDNQHSDYVGMYVLPWRWHSLKAGAVVGAFDGYPRANQGGWFPALIPQAPTHPTRHQSLVGQTL